jgi:hypothetical protein
MKLLLYCEINYLICNQYRLYFISPPLDSNWQPLRFENFCASAKFFGDFQNTKNELSFTFLLQKKTI